ncbi:hypothetical protein DDB_G0276699 [Dictyostelium discoideum AX4]|uniref:Uncharacterized protein n=1 Tax=Dictyostelium discoideum TaxID=44689 RepID=Q550Z7_DICDI|nr:hypothetical protein DDB_G0276699 [Dictyostelium discoideum AX4]EAL69107.1 hypothetical protein DDB_G0276699 [Dictyostelium discoideum AX4]|eukprot:XP_643041.1 hypothetical protein DDB_G0276699 [Dictyostelium discoideum AX4]
MLFKSLISFSFKSSSKSDSSISNNLNNSINQSNDTIALISASSFFTRPNFVNY